MGDTLFVVLPSHSSDAEATVKARQAPRDELYGLTAPLRRSSASVPANIAEGCGRSGDAEFARFCSIAIGSASELEYHLLLARDLELLGAEDCSDLAAQASEVKRMLTGLWQKLTADR
jgi:four helix bundle protein